ncbi:hypothetical protein OKW50_004872 [Paraburkholderia youngii]|uniref:DNA-binding protein n=1 Tax=Paraburkholderia youngii TaxID=2782701 RepID=UPI003D1E1A91
MPPRLALDSAAGGPHVALRRRHPDAIRATVLAMLAEAGETTSASDARFRRIVSVRKLRARLGAGDPATLSRHLNAIEAEVVHAGLTGFAVPDVPPAIAAQMRALWEAAVATQLVRATRNWPSPAPHSRRPRNGPPPPRMP